MVSRPLSENKYLIPPTALADVLCTVGAFIGTYTFPHIIESFGRSNVTRETKPC